MDEPKKRGRPPKPVTEKLVRRTVFLTAPQWEEYDALGDVEWLRPTLDKLAKKRKAQRKVK